MARSNHDELRMKAREEQAFKEQLDHFAAEEGKRFQREYQQFEQEHSDFVNYTSDELRTQAEKLYIQAQNKKRFGRIVKKSKRVVNAIVSMAALVMVAVLVASSTVEAVRSLVYNLVVEVDDEYAHVGVVDGKIEAGNWDQWYAPTYLPEAAALILADASDEIKTLNYHVVSPCEMYIGLDERIGEIDYSYALGVPPDTSFVDINGYAGFLSISGSSCILSWATEERFFLLTTEGVPRNEIIKIAASVQPAYR